MRIIRKHEGVDGGEELPGATFDGRARRTAVKPAADGDLNTGVSLVSFDPGARTHLHTHAGPQILQVVAGRCEVESGDERATLEAGDVVVFDPDEPHWHGASEDGPMTHLAVTLGGTAWLGSTREP